MEPIEMDISDDDTMNHAMTSEEVELARILHSLIRSHQLEQAKCFLQVFSPEMRYRLTRPNEEFHIIPAIFRAIKVGDVHFVSFLVNECNANYDEPARVSGTVHVNDIYTIGVGTVYLTPLEVAIRRSQADIVEYLANIGADVWRIARDRVTLHIACMTGSLRAVQILTDHGADLHSLHDEDEATMRLYEHKRQTCLMKAVCNAELCRYLIHKGVDVNVKNKDGDTALHFAASLNFCDAVKVLLENGADPFCKNNTGEDALQMAALCRCVETMDYLTQTFYKDVERQIESFQLLGAGYLNFPVHDNISKVLSAWKRAIALAAEKKVRIIPAKIATPLGFVVEATSLSEIDDLVLDNQIYLQQIVLIYKILGPTHDALFTAILSGALMYRESGSLARCLRLLAFGVQMTRNPDLNPSTRCSKLRRISTSTLSVFRSFFGRTAIAAVNFDEVYEFMDVIADVASKPIQPEETELIQKLFVNCVTLIFWTNRDDHQMFSLARLMHRFIKLRLVSENGRTLLMEASNLCRTLHSELMRPSTIFPYLEIHNMLLRCGADIEERDRDGNNVVHVLTALFHNLPKCNAVKNIALTFVEHGVHLDARNHAGVDTASCLRRLGIKIRPPINLMCIAARAIRRYNVPVIGVLPKCMIAFIEIH